VTDPVAVAVGLGEGLGLVAVGVVQILDPSVLVLLRSRLAELLRNWLAR